MLARELCIGPDGRAVFEEDGPEAWVLADSIEPTLCCIADLRVSLLSASLDEVHVRAAYEVERFETSSPVGVTHPRMNDLIAVEVGPGVYLNYRIELTHGEVLVGAEADLGEGELLLSQSGFWMEEE